MAGRVNIQIPVIDFSAYSLNKEVENIEDLHDLSEEICNALNTLGFFYIKNHGLSEETVNHVQSLSKQFLQLDKETKMKYRSTDDFSFFGYRELECDKYNPERPAPDLIEGLLVKFGETKWPKEVLKLEQAYIDFSKLAVELAMRVLDTISFKFCKTDIQTIRRYHSASKNFGDPQCNTLFRSNLYPKVKLSDVKKGQIRMGEHEDIGSLTLVFQDSEGLEVKTKDGEYIPVKPIPGTAVVNIGLMMQRWTSDELIAARHRVVFPRDADVMDDRQSLVVFCGTDMDAEIKCLDGTNKYEPTTARTLLTKAIQDFSLDSS